MQGNFNIGPRNVNATSEPYIIAEVGINHNGNLSTALEMIAVAKSSGADAVKFQTFRADEFCADPEQQFSYLSAGKEVTESMLSMFRRMELKSDDWLKIKEYADKSGIEFFSTPQNYSDLELLLPLGIKVIKVGSDDLTNLPLIRKYATSGLPIILSSGMSNLGEIYAGIEAAGWYQGKQVAVLVCTSLYPTPDADVNISRVSTLRAAFPNLIVGFSDHSQSNEAAVMATALGARIFEKHFTLNQNAKGPDHWFSTSPDELRGWVKSIRQSFVLLGSGQVIPSPPELLNKSEFQRVLVALCVLDKGQELNNFNVGPRRISGGRGLPPAFMDTLEGKRASKPYSMGDVIEI